MSSATATDAIPPAKRMGRKKLILIALAAALVLVGGAGAAALVLKKNADAAYDEHAEDAGDAATQATARSAPVFVPLDAFTVNLADRQADRYAQIGITLELDDAASGDRIKAFMPAIRNNILMAIADRTAADLLGREGKTLLAERVRREASRALGYAVDDAEPDTAEDPAAANARKSRKAAPALPVRAVHFSNFIIQ
jgi:flagellar FliL protein